MKTKLMLAVALSHHPELLILDEITSGLDPVIRDDILNILKDYVSGGNRSVFFSTHITSDLEKIADYVAFLHKGKLILMEELQKLKERMLLFQCSRAAFNLLDKTNIIRFQVNLDGSSFKVLANPSKAYNVFTPTKPTLDDIMLAHIKGETYDRLD